MTSQDQPRITPLNQSEPSQFIEWNRALIRSGFFFEKVGEQFDFSQENQDNQQFLGSILARLNQSPDFDGIILSAVSPTVDESEWLQAIEELHTGTEGGPSDMKGIQLEVMDTYMAGIVRWVNAAGFETHFSCDGHLRREPKMVLAENRYVPLLDFCFGALSGGEWRYTRHRLFRGEIAPRRDEAPMALYDRAWLLDVAESLHQNQTALQELVKAAKVLSGSGRR